MNREDEPLLLYCLLYVVERIYDKRIWAIIMKLGTKSTNQQHLEEVGESSLTTPTKINWKRSYLRVC